MLHLQPGCNHSLDLDSISCSASHANIICTLWRAIKNDWALQICERAIGSSICSTSGKVERAWAKWVSERSSWIRSHRPRATSDCRRRRGSSSARRRRCRPDLTRGGCSWIQWTWRSCAISPDILQRSGQKNSSRRSEILVARGYRQIPPSSLSQVAKAFIRSGSDLRNQPSIRTLVKALQTQHNLSIIVVPSHKRVIKLIWDRNLWETSEKTTNESSALTVISRCTLRKVEPKNLRFQALEPSYPPIFFFFFFF